MHPGRIDERLRSLCCALMPGPSFSPLILETRLMPKTFPSADIFCRVIDNFGDAGVCWRLASRFLSLSIRVRFITDRPDVLALLAPNAGQAAEVIAWDDFAAAAAKPGFQPAELIIETFGCRLPDAYDEAAARLRAERLARGERPPFYFNLDYLSAESWVEDCHGVTGLHPRLDLPKLWFFPGFTDRTGGLLIEEGLCARREAFSAEKAHFLASLGADPKRRTFFTFIYPVNDVPTLAEAFRLASESTPINVLAAPGAAGDQLEALLADAPRERLLTVRPPFLPQPEFDRLLWASDAAVVRGEDSFVRAQLAAVPFLWSTYPTEDHAHRIKLDAWLTRFTPSLAPEGLSERYAELSQAWLEGEVNPADLADFFLNAADCRPGFSRWSHALFARGDLAQRMLARAEEG